MRPALRGTAQLDGFLKDFARILLLHPLHPSDTGQDRDRLWSIYTLSQRENMSTLDEITREKQRVSEALARVDAQREKLAGQLAELEATERVLARYSKGSGVRRTAAARTPTSPRNPAAPARAGGTRRGTTTRPPGSQRSSPNLSDQVLALATGKTQPEIAAACKGARPNHVGAAISRHKRAGRIEERDGKLYAT
jgi:hypothetical protein